MYALSKLDAFIAQPEVSRFYETVPVGVRGPQSLFLNAVIVGSTELSARQLLDLLLAIESDRGRERPFPGAARTLDLDLVLLGRSSDRRARADVSRTRVSASAASCSSRWWRSRPSCAIR